MTQQNSHASTSSKQSHSREHSNSTGNGTSSPLPLSRPQGNVSDEWASYWQAQGQSWRTEPEISANDCIT